MRDRVLLTLVVIVALVAVLIYAGKRVGADDREVSPTGDSLSLLVIGVEGLEPSLIERFSRDGELPHLSALMDEGATGRFPSLERGIDLEIPWTSLVTGMRPENQGVGGMRVSQRGDLVPSPLTPKHRTVDTIWTLLSKAGETVGVVGWPGAWPVEPVNGVMVGPHDRAFLDKAHSGDIERRVYPAERHASLDEMYIDPATVRRVDLARFLNTDTHNPYEALIGQNYIALAGAFSEDETHRMVASRLTTDPGVDALLVCFSGLDAVSQRFWHYMEPERVIDGATLTDEAREEMLVQAETLGVVIERYYRYLDETIGELLELAADDATVAVATDHGYRGVELDWAGNPQLGYDMHSEEGFWIMRGPKVRPGVRVEESELFDFAATLMEAADIEPAVELDGVVLEDVIR